MHTTSRGYPYPDIDTDPPDGASQMQSLAQTVNDDVNGLVQAAGAPAIVQAGIFSVKFANSVFASVNVTFPKPFAQPPAVTCDVEPFTNNTPLTWGITGIAGTVGNYTGFTVYVRVVGTNPVTAAGLVARYIAVGVPASS